MFRGNSATPLPGLSRGQHYRHLGLGGMGGAQPLAVTMKGGVALCIEVDPQRAQRRIETNFLDLLAHLVRDAVALCVKARSNKQALSVGLIGNAADIIPELLAMGFPPDIVTDQTSAHDPLSYVPSGLSLQESVDLARSNPAKHTRRARASMAAHCAAMVVSALERVRGSVGSKMMMAAYPDCSADRKPLAQCGALRLQSLHGIRRHTWTA